MTKGNSLLCQLISAYEEEGYSISVGLNPLREKSFHGGFSCLLKKDLLENIDQPTIIPPLSTGGGISVDEINFLKDILQQFNPEIEYFIGIAACWSTNALGLINPSAKLYGIDNCSEGSEGKQALELAVKIANKLNINFHAYVGASPQDVPQSLEQVIKQGKTIDFALIDGLHTNEQVYLDFEAILPYLSDSAIVAFHDVLNFKMLEGWEKITLLASQFNFKNKILRRTTSGMGILYRNISAEIEATILSYYQHPFILCPT
ncbi:class I SAM-dependent methyltransferase [Anabaena aphanizomenioides LEGE 00250]|uniref:Class I SAM-dependent methyltransferase n=1 Tax=Sphaerospermopsis aphanizomenoides LEGE 00250 TaxID=2777972 RepID=A0ABR9VBT2_9CYAN|nr:class I SAM-dependent methyltransferase [Sphaerospermopsis aphanizomenoides]MBE9235964.1 class I SAM-dependent methyltransferase [Sphaerospermopsis aphanizomenoides LEGE 00250]